MLRIHEIIPVLFPAKLREMRRNGHRKFASCDLTRRYKFGRIKVMSLGPTLEVPTSNGSRFYPVEELAIPICWTSRDEEMQSSEAMRIALAKQLIENGVYSHDDLLIEKMGNKKLVVSKDYLYNLGNVVQPLNVGAYVVKLYTAFAVID